MLTIAQKLFLGEKKLCEKSFYNFVKQAWQYVEPDPFIDGWYAKAICDHCQAMYEGVFYEESDILLINIPPGCAKSLIVSVLFPVWLWIKDPDLREITGSRSADVMARDTVKSRELMRSEWFIKRWGSVITLAPDQNQKTNYNNTGFGVRIGFTTGGSITGIRGNYLGLDDPNDAKGEDTKTEYDEVNRNFGRALYSRLNNSAKTKKFAIIIMQRLAIGDLSDYLLKNYNPIYLFLPMEFEPGRCCETKIFKDPRTEKGELLCEALKDREEVEKMKKLFGTRTSAGQLQQRPVPLEGNIFKEAWFNKRFLFKDLPRFNYILLSLDTGWKLGRDNDFHSMQAWGVRDRRNYLIGRWRDKVSFNTLKNKCIELYDTYNRYQSGCYVAKMLIEEKAAGVDIIDVLKNDTTLNIEAIVPTVSKEVRAHAVTPMLEAGAVWFPADSECDWMGEFMDEILAFPTTKKDIHDDQVDSMTQALRWIQQQNNNSWANLCE